MKKLALLASTVGTTAAWYILSNKKLRGELANAKNPEATVSILKKYIGKDAEKIAKEVYEYMQSDEVKEGIDGAMQFAEGKMSDAKKGLGGLLARGLQWKEDVTRKMKSDAK